LHDQASQALIGRFTSLLHGDFRRTREVPFPNLGDRRSWDLMLRLEDCLVGVEAETRVRDVQALVRRIRQCQRDGGADEIVLVLSDTAHNRAVVGQLREALGAQFSTSPRAILAALRAGRRLPGSGVVLL
jgi:hypothetical protein